MTEREYLLIEKARIVEWLDRTITTAEWTHGRIVADYRYIRLLEIIERIRQLDTPEVVIVRADEVIATGGPVEVCPEGGGE